MLDRIKEGLKQYIVRESIQNQYFIETEYEMIHQNKISGFLALQLRQKNGERNLMYDVTGAESLAERAGKIHFDFEECVAIIESFRDVFQTVDEYMLEISHIDFSKNYIFRMKDGEIRFFYYPDRRYDTEKDLEEFLAWMLSQIDYQDSRCVKYIYRAYDLVRSQGVSPRTIEQILDFSYRREIPYEYKEYEEKERAEEKEESIIDVSEAKKEKNLLDIFLIIGVICSVCMASYWVSLFCRYGPTAYLIQYVAGSLCLGIFFVMVLWGRKRIATEK